MRLILFAVTICILTAVTIATRPRALPPATQLTALASLARGPNINIAIEAVNGTPVAYDSVVAGIGRGTLIHIEGWAIDPAKHTPASAVLGLVDGRPTTEATYGIATPDVASMLRNDHFTAVGFNLKVESSELPLGPHRITFLVVARNRSMTYPAEQTINILLVPPGVHRPIVIGDGHHIVGSLDQVTTIDRAFEFGPENEPVWLANATTLFLRGWAVDVAHHQEISQYLLTVDDKRRVVVHSGDIRPELATTFPTLPNITAAYAGYTAALPTATLPTGNHRFTFSAVDPKTRERVLLFKDFAFATYDPRRLAKVIEPGWGPSRPIRFADVSTFAGSIDVINPLTRADESNRQTLPVWVDRGDYLFIRGWCVDPVNRASPRHAQVVIDGRTRFDVNLGEPRPDIVPLFPTISNKITMYSGFSAAIPLFKYGMGSHHLTLVAQHVASSKWFVLFADFPFTIL